MWAHWDHHLGALWQIGIARLLLGDGRHVGRYSLHKLCDLGSFGDHSEEPRGQYLWRTEVDLMVCLSIHRALSGRLSPPVPALGQMKFWSYF